MKIFQTENIQLVKKSLDLYTRQHGAIAKNIANANTENYTREKTDFTNVLKQDLDRTLKVTHALHIQESKTPDRSSAKGPQEKVDVSKEMGELAQNQIRYDFAARTLAKAYRALNLSIVGRNS